ncbi:phosphatase PAP2 family protein [Lysobacter firmicutimachus]|uniref:Phosphatase PAP2 family protein n=2 Tax=Lysobacter firmicutimachus TaxID=1792846 RepID=A0AAU8MUD3_9GAMM
MPHPRSGPDALSGLPPLPMIETTTVPLNPVAGPARSAAGASRRFLLRHAAWPAVALLVASLATMAAGGDFWWADRLYAWQGARWAWQNAYLTEHLIHRFGRDVSAAAWLGVLALWLGARLRPGLNEWRRPLGYLLLAVLISVGLVSGLKQLTGMDCPWDLQRYGGGHPFVGWLAARPAGLGRGGCFPAGHASAGYAWVALYFFFLAVQPRRRWLGLAIGLGFGLVFGFGQQLRGAHFLSHDVWSLAIAWFASLALYLATMARPAPVAAIGARSRSAGR